MDPKVILNRDTSGFPVVRYKDAMNALERLRQGPMDGDLYMVLSFIVRTLAIIDEKSPPEK